MKRRNGIAGLAVMGLFLLAMFGLTANASASEYDVFNTCPMSNTEVFKCLYSVTEGGEVKLGNKDVPIVNPVKLRGGYSKAPRQTRVAQFFGATDGVTLQPVAQPLPGGLAGLVNCREISNFILRTSCEWTFENGITGVNATLELARPASEIQISEYHLIGETEVALKLPVKVHLENPFLGGSCYVGSSSEPIIWNLTSGATSPPAPNESIHGASGEVESVDEGRIARLVGNKLVDNAWAAPEAEGCGGIFSFLLDPIVNLIAGVPASAGNNTAILNNTIEIAEAGTVEEELGS